MIFDADAFRAGHDAPRQRSARVIVGVRRRMHEVRAVGVEKLIELGHRKLLRVIDE
jgi:hypothetical protein